MSVGEVNINQEQDARNYSSARSGEFNMSIPFVPPIVEIQTWSPEKMKKDLEEDYHVEKEDGWWARFLSNHDKPRQVSLYGNDRAYWKECVKMPACYIHTLPGTPFVYQGEELGMTNIQYDSIEQYDDIDTKNYYMNMLSNGVSKRGVGRPVPVYSAETMEERPCKGTTQTLESSQHQPWLKTN